MVEAIGKGTVKETSIQRADRTAVWKSVSDRLDLKRKRNGSGQAERSSSAYAMTSRTVAIDIRECAFDHGAEIGVSLHRCDHPLNIFPIRKSREFWEFSLQ